MRRFILWTACLALLLAPRAHGHVFFITDTNDSVRLTSLRGAIIAANYLGGNNTIFLGQPTHWWRPQPFVYHLTISGANEDNARTGDLDITNGQLTIASMFSNVTIDATDLGDRIFQIFPHAQLTLVNLIIQGGTAPSFPKLDNVPDGGAVRNAGTLILEHCIITNNICGDGGNGGAIKNEGTCILLDSIISGNQSGAGDPVTGIYVGTGGDGGGIFNSGTMILNQCIISSNISGTGTDGKFPGGIITLPFPGLNGFDAGNGAGIYNAGQMRINFSSIYSNHSGAGGNGIGGTGHGANGGNGAGIFNAGKLILNTSTISGNLCGKAGFGGNGFGGRGGAGGVGGSGGGICNAGWLALNSCTITFNQTGAGGNGGNGGRSSPTPGGPGGNGGGVFNVGDTNVETQNTLITLNLINIGGAGGYTGGPPTAPHNQGDSGADGVGFDVVGNFTSQKFNLIGKSDNSTGFTNGVNNDQVGSIAAPIDPLLGPLQMNGGSTPTHALLPGSPAIDQGNSFGLHTDQRGQRRPHNFTTIPNPGDGSDIGAFELGK